MTRIPSVTGMLPLALWSHPHHASIVAMINDACKLLFLLVQNSKPPCLTFDALSLLCGLTTLVVLVCLATTRWMTKDCRHWCALLRMRYPSAEMVQTHVPSSGLETTTCPGLA